MNTNIIIEIILMLGIMFFYMVFGAAGAEYIKNKVKNPVLRGFALVACAAPSLLCFAAALLLVMRIQCWVQRCNPAALRVALGL